MSLSRRLIILASSVLLLFVLALSLATSIEVRAPPHKIIQISLAQEAKVGQSDREITAKGRINDTDFDRADILNGTMTISRHPETIHISLDASRTPIPTASIDGEGMIGETKTSQPVQTSNDEGFIGQPSSSITPSPTLAPPPPPALQVPILALSYAGSGGPKHCRGDLLQKLSLPPPPTTNTTGTCIDLPSAARCGVFFAGKEAACEADLFNMEGCVNTTSSYVNTVVFMPEERTVGAYWRSMMVRCGVEAPEASLLDPSLLSGLLKPPGTG
jgi:hypothetical protein